MIFSPTFLEEFYFAETNRIGNIDDLSFPVNILAEKTEDVAYAADRKQMEALIRHGAIIGIGNRNNLKKFKLITSLEKLKKINKFRLQVKPSAACNKTTFLDGKTHSHHNTRCRAYGSEMREAYR